jgi:flagellar hook-basal body complex protein FliE
MDMSFAAVRNYGAARPLTAPDPAAQPRSDLGRAADSFARTLARAETSAAEAMAGRGDPHALVASLAEAQLAVETVVAVRDKVVEAYMEILRMPV